VGPTFGPRSFAADMRPAGLQRPESTGPTSHRVESGPFAVFGRSDPGKFDRRIRVEWPGEVAGQRRAGE